MYWIDADKSFGFVGSAGLECDNLCIVLRVQSSLIFQHEINDPDWLSRLTGDELMGIHNKIKHHEEYVAYGINDNDPMFQRDQNAWPRAVVDDEISHSTNGDDSTVSEGTSEVVPSSKATKSPSSLVRHVTQPSSSSDEGETNQSED